jgi:calcineurin-like phosphoesterase family protein
MAIFFTADTHFQHEKIIGFCNRPFSSVEEMDKTLFTNWNAVVRPKDAVYHLGDVFFGDHDTFLPMLKKLNGRKYLVQGNHDNAAKLELLAEYFEILPPLTDIGFEWKIGGIEEKFRIVLCHYPLLTWSRSRFGALMLYGHVHGRVPADAQSLDVGVDCWNYYPARFEDIVARMKTLPPRQWVGEAAATVGTGALQGTCP